jgi:hypothetical protein
VKEIRVEREWHSGETLIVFGYPIDITLLREST